MLEWYCTCCHSRSFQCCAWCGCTAARPTLFAGIFSSTAKAKMKHIQQHKGCYVILPTYVAGGVTFQNAPIPSFKCVFGNKATHCRRSLHINTITRLEPLSWKVCCWQLQERFQQRVVRLHTANSSRQYSTQLFFEQANQRWNGRCKYCLPHTIANNIIK